MKKFLVILASLLLIGTQAYAAEAAKAPAKAASASKPAPKAAEKPASATTKKAEKK